MQSMNLNALVHKLDAWQQKHPILGFPYAVIKKYGDDNGGYQAALLTYYGFLSLFPLLLVLVTVLQLWFHNDDHIRTDVVQSIAHYFPLLNDQLQHNIHSMSKTGLGLVIALLITFYGARGVADALRYILDNMWQVPKSERSGFPKNILHSLSIMICGSLAFVGAVGISAFSNTLGHAMWVKVFLNLLGFATITLVLGLIFRVATFGRVPIKYMFLGAGVAGFIMQVLLTFGGLILKHQLQNLNSLYGTFAVVLGLLFWIYLLAQVVVYAAEVDTVRHLSLWPRSITSELRTEADHKAYKMYAKTETRLREEHVRVDFDSKD